MLRAAGSRDVAEIPLRDELEVLTPYLEVQRTRFSDWLEIELQIDPATERLLVPPLVLQPLVENAIKYAVSPQESGAEITVSTQLVGPNLRITVSDTGPGIPFDHQTRVFEPFFTTKEVGKGSGLGLSQVFGFASQSGGGVDLSSTPGAGTSLVIRLPVAGGE